MTSPNNISQGRIRVGKVPFEIATMADAVEQVLLAAQMGRPTPVRLSNAYCVALASKDADYEKLLNGPGLNYPDGTPVAWFMKRRNQSGNPLSRVRGPSLFTEVLKVSAENSLAHYFLGTTDDTLRKLELAVKEKLPELKLAGSYAPPFAPVSEDFIRDCETRISDSGADLVWVGLGTPKQDYVAAELSRRLALPCMGVGAAFDFVAGTVNEAPFWMQRSGTEWVYRLMSEPRRLWKRYLFGNIRFMYTALVDSRKQGPSCV